MAEWLVMEQVEVQAGATVPAVLLGRTLSEEARASLQAVWAAQDAARLRARRQTVQARICFVAFVAAVALVGFRFGPRLTHRSHAAARVTAPAQPAPIAPESPAAATSPAVPAMIAQGADAPVADGRAAPDPGCDTALLRTAPWRLSPDACARTFQANPGDAALALGIAQAYHAHSRGAEAEQWAKRALSLDPDAAEAYVIIARSNAADGHPEAAQAAYRHYMELAPRGWHRAEARAALRHR